MTSRSQFSSVNTEGCPSTSSTFFEKYLKTLCSGSPASPMNSKIFWELVKDAQEFLNK